MATHYTLTLNEIAAYELPAPSQTKLSAAKREEILEKVVAWKVAHDGLREDSRGEHQVILTGRKWTGGEKRTTLSVDEYGEVTAIVPGPRRWDY